MLLEGHALHDSISVILLYVLSGQIIQFPLSVFEYPLLHTHDLDRCEAIGVVLNCGHCKHCIDVDVVYVATGHGEHTAWDVSSDLIYPLLHLQVKISVLARYSENEFSKQVVHSCDPADDLYLPGPHAAHMVLFE